MANLVRAFLAVAVAALCGASQGQEFDIFDANDFLDPRIRGAVFSNNQCGKVSDTRCGVHAEGTPFTIARVYTGRVGDYVWRNEATKVDLSFLHLTMSSYRRENQFNAKLTLMHGDRENALPRYKGTLQYGYYFLTNTLSPEADPNDTNARASGRVLVTASFEENGFSRSSKNDAHRFNYELGAQLDANLRIHETTVLGSLVWARRYAYEEGVVHRVTYFYRTGDYAKKPFRLSARFGVGGEKVEEWEWGLLRAIFQATVDVKPLKAKLNFAYAPSYLPGDRDRNVHHEVSVFLDATVFRSFHWGSN